MHYSQILISRPMGQPARTSKNLRAITEHARHVPVARIVSDVETYHRGEIVRGACWVIFADGSTGRASFASYRIMMDWLRNRIKYARGMHWHRAEWVKFGPDVGYLTKPGLIAGE